MWIERKIKKTYSDKTEILILSNGLLFQVYSELEAIVDKLANESQRGSYTLKRNSESQSPKSPNANSS